MIDIEKLLQNNPDKDKISLTVELFEEGNLSVETEFWDEIFYDQNNIFYLPDGELEQSFWSDYSGYFIYELNGQIKPIRLYNWILNENTLSIKEIIRIEPKEYLLLYEKLFLKFSSFRDFSRIFSIQSLSDSFLQFWKDQGFKVVAVFFSELREGWRSMSYKAEFGKNLYVITHPQIDGTESLNYGIGDNQDFLSEEFNFYLWDEFIEAKKKDDWKLYSGIESVDEDYFDSPYLTIDPI